MITNVIYRRVLLCEFDLQLKAAKFCILSNLTTSGSHSIPHRQSSALWPFDLTRLVI